MITSNVAFYPCTDIEKTDAFYTGIIGLKTAFSGPVVRIFSTVNGYFGFVQYDDIKISPQGLCLSLNCPSFDEVDREYERVTALGGGVQGPPARHSTQPVYSFFLRDPDGYLVEFQKLLDADL